MDTKLVFVVDDDPVIRKVVSVKFRDKYNIKEISYGEECIENLHLNPDLIVLDFVFFKTGEVVMNGKETLSAIRERNEDIPVIMLSGQESGDIVLELARMGISDYIIKDKDLMNNLEEALEDIFEEEEED